jgi:FkbM family methyltransferase
MKFRWKWARLGVRFLRTRDFRLDHVAVHGRRVALNYPEGERKVLEHELAQIYFEDCYRLGRVSPRPARVLDVGGNVGMFSLVARHHFPTAVIHCYEPNPRLHGFLRGHVEPLEVKVFGEAVGDRAGTVAMAGGSGSLYGTVVADAGGTVPMIAFDTAVERIGGDVGLLKLDCEGAEWGILENSKAFDAVAVLTMEYHLWARPGSTTRDIATLVEKRGLRVREVVQRPGEEWGLLFAKRA